MRISDWSSDVCSSDLLYNSLRATWERGLEDIAFVRVIQRHRDYINAKDLKKVSALNEADCDAFAAGFKKCCDIVDAHDPSSGRNAAPPPPTDLFQDIQALKDWAASLRDRSEEHTSELPSLMRTQYAVFCLKKKKNSHRYSENHYPK